MSVQEQQNLEKTLSILSKKLQQAQQQYKETKKTVHTKKAFLLSSKSVLQQDFQHAFIIQKRRRQPKSLLSVVPPGLLPLISTREAISTETTLIDQHIQIISCSGIIKQDYIWFKMKINNQSSENIVQANMTLTSINSISFEVIRSTLHNISALSNHILYAAMMVPPKLSPEKLVSMNMKLSCKYMLENGNWLESSAMDVQWMNNKKNDADHDQYINEWILKDCDNISIWAPIFYPYKIHLSYSDTTILKDWIRLNDDIFISPDDSLLFVKSNDITILPIQSHLYGLKEQAISSWLYQTKIDQYMIPYDGMHMDTYNRLKNIIVSLMDVQTLSAESSSHNHLINSENSLVQLSSLVPN
ncbi:hypothetical protein BJ944DRAFT_267091, partial [Cunninghamella echinulata]